MTQEEILNSQEKILQLRLLLDLLSIISYKDSCPNKGNMFDVISFIKKYTPARGSGVVQRWAHNPQTRVQISAPLPLTNKT